MAAKDLNIEPVALITPAYEAYFPSILAPDAKYSPDNYECVLIVDPTVEGHDEFVKQVAEFEASVATELAIKHPTIRTKKIKDKDGNERQVNVIKARRSVKDNTVNNNAPPIYTVDNKPFREAYPHLKFIPTGTRMKAQILLTASDSHFGGSIVARLLAVQIVDMPNVSAGGSPFTAQTTVRDDGDVDPSNITNEDLSDF